MTDFVRRFGQRHADGTYYFSNVRSGLIVALLSIGTLFGALVAAPIADKVGRRHSISFWSTIVCVGVIVQISSTDKWYQIMMGRFVAGLGVGALSLLVPMYQVSQQSERPRTDMLTINRLRQRPVTFEAPSYQPINS
jgi:SP family sugar:H+ symporter-like MFS transporter